MTAFDAPEAAIFAAHGTTERYGPGMRANGEAREEKADAPMADRLRIIKMPPSPRQGGAG
jgi:hypothetical protein